ncbi:hypothetical protein SLA2020_348080 [Shorea laevis]
MVETTMRKSDRFLSCKNKIMVIYVHICHHQQIRTTRKTQPSLKRFILSFDWIHTKKKKRKANSEAKRSEKLGSSPAILKIRRDQATSGRGGKLRSISSSPRAGGRSQLTMDDESESLCAPAPTIWWKSATVRSNLQKSRWFPLMFGNPLKK